MTEWLTVKQAAERLGCDPSTLYRLCATRRIRHRRIGAGGGRIVFLPADLTTYLDSCVVEIGQEEPELASAPAATLKHLRPQSRRA